MRNVVLASFCFMKVVHEGVVSMCRLCYFLFSMSCENLMRKVRVLKV